MKIVFALILIRLTLGSTIICPGGRRECPTGNTCCQLPGGSYGCCPLPNAVCCADHVHCCPQGTRCESGSCYQTHYNESSSNTFKHDTLCPGGKYSCPEDSTCCKTPQSHIYSCCLLPNAVCCADGESCCPQFSTCDLEKKRCVQNDFYLQMYSMLKTRSKFLNKKLGGNIVHPSKVTNGSSISLNSTSMTCPGGIFVCPDGNTCCKLSDGTYECCGFENAVCCTDHHYCCPGGTVCDSSIEACRPGQKSVQWSKRVLAAKTKIIN